MNKHKILVVRWVDARGQDGFFSPGEFKEFTCIEMETVGFGYELDDRVVLASDYYPSRENQKEGYRGVSNIPKKCIKSIQKLEEK